MLSRWWFCWVNHYSMYSFGAGHWAFQKHANSEAQKPPSQLRFSLPLIVIRITSNEPWNTETHKLCEFLCFKVFKNRNPPITNQKPWPFEPVEVNLWFLRGPLRWLASDNFLTRGSKWANHRKTILIAYLLRGHLNLLFLMLFDPKLFKAVGRSSLDKIWRRFEERINILLKYIIVP